MIPAKPISLKLEKKYAKYLAPGERIIYLSGISPRYFWSYFFLYFLLSFILIGIPKLSSLVHQRRANVYILTTHKMLIIKGIFAIKVVSAMLDRVTHVTVEQSFSERFFYNSGQIVVITAGFDKREIVIENISNPVRFKVLLEELTQKYESDRGGNVSAEDEVAMPSKIRPLKIRSN